MKPGAFYSLTDDIKNFLVCNFSISVHAGEKRSEFMFNRLLSRTDCHFHFFSLTGKPGSDSQLM